MNTDTIYKTNKTGVKGVFFDSRKNMYHAEIWFNGKRYSLGDHIELDEAIKARKAGEERIKDNFLEWYNRVKPNRKKSNIESPVIFETLPKEEKVELLSQEIANNKITCNTYLNAITNILGITTKEYIVGLVRQDMFTHPDIIEEIRGATLG